MQPRLYVFFVLLMTLLILLSGVATAQSPSPDAITQLTLPFDGTVNTTGAGFAVLNTGAGQSAVGVAGRSDNGYAGLVGYSANRHGAFGLSVSATDAGVYGRNDGAGIGVWARADNGTALQATSVNGQAMVARSVNGKALYATTAVNGDTAIFAENTGPSGFGLIATTRNGHAIRGEAQNGQGVVAIGRNADGIDAQTSAADRAAVYAHHESDTNGYGVLATTNRGAGVFATSNNGVGVRAESSTDHGVYGVSRAANRAGVYGQSDSGGIGVHGVGRGGNGVRAESSCCDALEAFTTANDYSALYAHFDGDDFGNAVYVSGGRGIGIQVRSSREDAIDAEARRDGRSAIYAHHDDDNGSAGYFRGNVSITGNVDGGLFKTSIDHPQDPANKLLQHALVESNQYMNILNGNVVTDAKGEAAVALPAYYETSFGDFRYQLTVVGQFAQAIVGSKIKDGVFLIRTDKPNVEVSWQVTGIRRDAVASANPLVVEQAKTASQQGYYISPSLYDQPERARLEYSRDPDSHAARQAMDQRYEATSGTSR